MIGQTQKINKIAIKKFLHRFQNERSDQLIRFVLLLEWPRVLLYNFLLINPLVYTNKHKPPKFHITKPRPVKKAIVCWACLLRTDALLLPSQPQVLLFQLVVVLLQSVSPLQAVDQELPDSISRIRDNLQRDGAQPKLGKIIEKS